MGKGKNGKEYVLIDPSVSLAGVLLKQNVLAQKRGEQPSDMVMTSVFEESNQQQVQQQSKGFSQNQNNFQQNQNNASSFQPQPPNYQNK